MFSLISFMLRPNKYEGNIPTSERTEYLPIYFLCSTKYRLNFFERLCNILFVFSAIKIKFFASFFKIFKKNKLEIVSIVSPDFDITIKRILLKFSF